jgi:CRP-like cAMP-binding protein
MAVKTDQPSNTYLYIDFYNMLNQENISNEISEVLARVFTEKLGLSQDHVDMFRRISKIKQISKKDFLIKEGSVCNFIGIVISGTLRSFIMADGDDRNNDFYFEGAFISAYTSFLTQRPTNCNIEALADSVVVYITHAQYQQLIADDATWYKLGSYVAESFFITKCRRETMFLTDAASVRLEKVLAMYPGIEQRVAQYHIASYVGVKPESLSRVKLAAHQDK